MKLKILHKHEGKCFGITLWKWCKRLELWFILPHYTIKPHTHPDQNVTLVHIFSDAYIYRIRTDKISQLCAKPFRFMFRAFEIRANDVHGFTTFDYPFLFLNIMDNTSQSPIDNFKEN